ncbi:MAG TPA: hypothetical protein VFI69_04510 [Candidatus Limnocylindrales bacterium]|nr:hypothetical protein [Candidatus Limnocylindrales bacterium]
MFRPNLTPTVALATTVLLAAGLAACQGQTVPLLTDPKAILTAAATEAAAASSVHVDLTAEGSLVVDPLGTGAGAPIELRGTTAAADVDLTGRDARTTFALPGLLGLSGEVIALDDTLYVRSTLTGAQYHVTDLTAAGGASAPPESPLKGLVDLLSQPGLDPVKGDDVPCGSGTCYTVTIDLTASELAALGADGIPLPTDLPIPLPDLGAASVQLKVRVDHTTTRLAGISAAADLGDTGELTAELTFTKWGDAVSISPPPADQIAPPG